jgi:hypothetical protein
MIKETQVCDVITNEIPQMAIDLSMIKDNDSVCKTIACFADYTKDLIREHNVNEAIHCFRTANNLMKEGTAAVQNSIVNVYVSSISRLVECSQTVEEIVRMQFLKIFGKEYYKLIYAQNP